MPELTTSSPNRDAEQQSRQLVTPLAGTWSADVFCVPSPSGSVLVKRLRCQPSDLTLKAEVIQALAAMSTRYASVVHPNLANVIHDGEMDLTRPSYAEADVVDYLLRFPDQRLYIILGITTGLAFLHRCGRVHANIYPGNVVVDKEGRAILVDAGIYAAIYPVLGRGRLSHTIVWKSPEEIMMEPPYMFTAAMDIYCLGSTIYRLYTGSPPFNPAFPSKAVMKIVQTGHVSLPRPLSIDATMWDCIVRCWEPDPQLRPTAEELVAFLTNILLPH